jgi:hypothetical protein
MLFVELVESPTRPQGFIVRVLSQAPEDVNPGVTEILPQKSVVLQANGGNGEAGRRGSDGQSGMNGVGGTPATRVQVRFPF